MYDFNIKNEKNTLYSRINISYIMYTLSHFKLQFYQFCHNQFVK
jgi:hypothetical protein